MLLFSDGFDSYNIDDIRYKWGFLTWAAPGGSVPQIVSGMDTSVFPNQAFATKDGRALHVARTALSMGTVFKPSRTVFAGFAVRALPGSDGNLVITIKFLSNMIMERGRQVEGIGFVQGERFLSGASIVSTLTLTICPSYTDVNWTFLNGITRNHRINTTMNMLSGDYHYIQAAMTLAGNDSAQPQAWIEIKLGNRETNKYSEQNILTTLPDGVGKSYMNGILFSFNKSGYTDTHQAVTTIDDVYICNDEGDVNNTFLGNVKVRRAVPVAEGSSNDAVPYGASYRHQCVDEDFIDTEHSMPFPIPTPEQDPQFLEWEPGLNDYLELQELGHRQLLRFTAVNYFGSLPRIFGAILHPLAMGKHRTSGQVTALRGLKKTGIHPIVEAIPTDIPLRGASPDLFLTGVSAYAPPPRLLSWQNYPLVFENDEVVAPGQPNQIWRPEILNDSEFGFELASCEIDPLMYDPNLVRFSITTDEVVSEFLGLGDYTHRYFEEPILESLVLEDGEPTYQYTWKFTDGLYLNVELMVQKTFPRFINETLRFDDVVPWLYQSAVETLGFEDEIFVQWLNVVVDEITLDDWTDGFWEELFADTFDVSDEIKASFIEILEEVFGLEEPYLWDGHEDIEESLGLNVTYIWDNHELLEEYLYPDDGVTQGIGLVIEDGLGITEDHFGGNWVEAFDDHFGAEVSVLTQHWRYEVLFGLVLNSWQVEPIEQIGAIDGDHTGDNPWGA